MLPLLCAYSEQRAPWPAGWFASSSCCPAIDLFRIDPFHGNTIATAKCSCSMQVRLCWECSLGRYRCEQRERLPLSSHALCHAYSCLCFVPCILQGWTASLRRPLQGSRRGSLGPPGSLQKHIHGRCLVAPPRKELDRR